MYRSLNWIKDMKRFEKASTSRAVWQLVNTFIPYTALWALMVLMIRGGVPYVFTLIVSIPASLFLVRLFIFFHDTCHGSFFGSSRANRIAGRMLGILFFTSFDEFRYTPVSYTHLRAHET